MFNVDEIDYRMSLQKKQVPLQFVYLGAPQIQDSIWVKGPVQLWLDGVGLQTTSKRTIKILEISKFQLGRSYF